MTDFRDRFRAFDRLDPPDVFAQAETRGVRGPAERPPSPLRRAVVVVVAAAVAVAGIGLLLRARGGPATQPASPAPSAAPATPTVGPGGLLAFAYVGGAPGSVIGVMSPDGTGFRQLTGYLGDHQADPWYTKYDPRGYASDDSPTFSPDGNTIAFVRRYAEGVDSLAMIDIDGSNFRIVIRNAHAAELSWSPDGRTIAFYSEQDGGIHLVNADGTHERALWQRTGGPNQDSPSWSADSSRVYYASGDIWVADANGSAARRVVQLPRTATWVALCPEGSPIAFAEAEPGGDTSAIWLVDPDGSDLTRVTSADSGSWSSVSWNPFGNVLLVIADNGTAAMIRPDGSNLRPLPMPDGLRFLGAVAWWGPAP